MEWYHFKEMISISLGVSQDSLHVIVGVGFQVLVALVFRLRLSQLVPWLVVLGFELANEWADLRLEFWPDRNVQVLESLKDLSVTMLLPTALMLLVRFAPFLFVGASPAPAPQGSRMRTGLESEGPSDARSGE